MNEQNIVLLAGGGDVFHTVGIDVVGNLLFAFGFVNGSVGGSIDADVNFVLRKNFLNAVGFCNVERSNAVKEKLKLRIAGGKNFYFAAKLTIRTGD